MHAKSWRQTIVTIIVFVGKVSTPQQRQHKEIRMIRDKRRTKRERERERQTERERKTEIEREKYKKGGILPSEVPC